jgi:hypothetical protein
VILGPENVRAVLRDGTEVPVEVVYSHDSGGIAIWRNVHPVDGDVVGVRVAVLPPQVGIEIVHHFD